MQHSTKTTLLKITNDLLWLTEVISWMQTKLHKLNCYKSDVMIMVPNPSPKPLTTSASPSIAPLCPPLHLGVIFHSNLSFKFYANLIFKTAFSHLNNIACLHPSHSFLLLKIWSIPSSHPDLTTVIIFYGSSFKSRNRALLYPECCLHAPSLLLLWPQHPCPKIRPLTPCPKRYSRQAPYSFTHKNPPPLLPHHLLHCHTHPHRLCFCSCQPPVHTI